MPSLDAWGTFVFADIAGYTALTEAHGDADAAELAAQFCRAISEVAAESGGEVDQDDRRRR